MNDHNEIQEEEPLLVGADQEEFVQAKKTYSLNAGVNNTPKSLNHMSLGSDAGEAQVKKALTMAARGMSLATRGDIDPIALVEQAKQLCKQPIKLSWENVRFEAEVATTAADRAKNPHLGKTKRLEIVKSVSGFAAPGQATYIMGSSGAGKTSLLNILADRVTSATNTWLSGNIVFNDTIPVNKESFQKYAAYVMQDDVLFSRFTVREALTFAARLKLKVSEQEQDDLVRHLIDDLGLSHCSESEIGDVHRKVLSGGERKRCSIGVELVSDPSVVLLDEPTSGLDSFKARSICELLHRLAREQGKTIVSTIHSPSSEAFFFFDRLILMADGHIVYQGDAKKSVDYFKKIDRPVPRQTNPADFFMKLLAINYPKGPADEDKMDYLNRYYHALIEKPVKADSRAIRLAPPKTSGAEAINHKATQMVQLQQLMHRSWTIAKREPRLSRAKLVNTIVVAFLMMGAFYQVNDYLSAEEVKNMAGAIYYMNIVNMQFNFQPTIIIFQGEKPIYQRERDSGMYDIWIYATTKLIAEIPINLIVPFVFMCLIYFAVGLTDAFTNFIAFYFVIVFMIQASTAMGYALSSVFAHESTAIAFAPIVNMPLNLLGGFMINLNGIMQESPQKFVAWLGYFSPIRYGFTALMLVQFPVYGYKGDMDAAYPETVKILESYGFQDNSFWGCLAILISLFVFFRLLVILSLYCQDKSKSSVKNDTRNTNIQVRKEIAE